MLYRTKVADCIEKLVIMFFSDLLKPTPDNFNCWLISTPNNYQTSPSTLSVFVWKGGGKLPPLHVSYDISVKRR